jgi:hypothetical protein
LEFGNRYHYGLVRLVLNIHICYDKIGILYVGFDSMIGIVFYKMCITTYEVTVNVASTVPDK